ncbi:hypothetical protein ACFV14_37070 [Streptomyces zaomyceticus]|uniref:hypothetical protein n=1 Tax=Streptomyces zaomyceticus TaxID=68286 RepID=UPI0036A69BDA
MENDPSPRARPVDRQWGDVDTLRQWLDREQRPEPVREVRMARVLAVGTAYGLRPSR